MILPESCAERASRYRNAEDRKRSAIGYLMLLYALRQRCGTGHVDLKFGEHGKPYLESPKVYFNISHCKKGCVCVVSDREIGVDIQEIRPYSQRLAERVCCENELVLLEKSDDKAAEFAKIWAMKESYVKMDGRGIGYSLKKADTTVLDFDEIIYRNDCFIVVSEK